MPTGHSLSLHFKENFHWRHCLESHYSGPGKALFPPQLLVDFKEGWCNSALAWWTGSLSVCPSTHSSINYSIHTPIHPSTHLPTYPPTHPPTPPSIHPSMWADRYIVTTRTYCQFCVLNLHLSLNLGWFWWYYICTVTNHLKSYLETVYTRKRIY